MIVDLGPLLRGARGTELRVAGVAAGESAEGIDRAQLTHAAENDPGESRSYADGTVYRTLPDGRRVEVPLAERVDATLRGGGFLWCGDVTLRIDEGRVVRLFVRGPSLQTLGLARQADVVRAFGPADAEELKVGWRIHHHRARELSISWDEGEDRLEHVALGPVTYEEPRLGAPALLDELLGASPALGPRWLEPSEGSARIRYQRVAALARALGLGSPAQVVAGAFLEEAPEPGRQRVLDELAARAPLRPRRHASGHVAFRMLLHYRFDVERVIRATSGWLECGDPVLLGMIATQNVVGAGLRELVADVDRLLCALMDPEGRTVERRELVARHGWPDVDLQQLLSDEL